MKKKKAIQLFGALEVNPIEHKISKESAIEKSLLGNKMMRYP